MRSKFTIPREGGKAEWDDVQLVAKKMAALVARHRARKRRKAERQRQLDAIPRQADIDLGSNFQIPTCD